MKSIFLLIATLFVSVSHAFAAVTLDDEAFGQSLGGWKKRSNSAAEYPLSGSAYRTYKPEISPTPDGGIFVSIRIDHVRGWLSSDDHAVLEITVNSKGAIASAQSTIAIQGRSIKSDVILGGNQAGAAILSPEGAVQIGTDLVANLSAKLLRENIVEAGRVSLPAVLRHNYNRLFQAIRVDGAQVIPGAPVAAVPSVETTAPTPPVPVAIPVPMPPEASAPPAPLEKPKEEEPAAVPLEIKPYG